MYRTCFLKAVSICSLLIALSACGGGGGGGNNNPAGPGSGTPPETNNTWDDLVWDQDEWG